MSGKVLNLAVKSLSPAPLQSPKWHSAKCHLAEFHVLQHLAEETIYCSAECRCVKCRSSLMPFNQMSFGRMTFNETLGRRVFYVYVECRSAQCHRVECSGAIFHDIPHRWIVMPYPGNPYWRERISTIHLLVLTSSNQRLFTENIISSLTKQTILMRRSNVPCLPFQREFPVLSICLVFNIKWDSSSVGWRCWRCCRVLGTYLDP